MKSAVVGLLTLVFIVSISNFGLAESVKKPNVSGAFYPADPKVLSAQIDDYLNKADVELPDGRIIAIISPHAGYIYSGPVAAYGYKAIKGKGYKTVVILAATHYLQFDSFSAWPEGSLATPLGAVAVDSEFISKLMSESTIVKSVPAAFSKEHSLEVQIPFLQKVLGADFKIVPIIMGQATLDECEGFASALYNVIGDRSDVLIVASSDLSHYHPYDMACAIDEETINYIKSFNEAELWDKESSGEAQLCGLRPVVTTLIYAKKQNAEGIKVLKYANSGDTQGDKTKVVGYSAIAIYKTKPEKQEVANMLNDEQRKLLLKIARETMEGYIKTGKKPDFKIDDPLLNKKMGAFVTIHDKGELRGCIGNIYGTKPLYQTISDMAVVSSTEDPRFYPVKEDELKNIDIEISVLSVPERIKNIDEFKLGTHGVIVKRGFNSGVFLPQVATETGWSKEEFLSNLCAHKAGLSADAWKNKDAEIYIFSAEVFSEKSH